MTKQEQRRQYYLAHREKAIEYSRNYRLSHPGKRTDESRRYCKRYPEKVKEYRKQYHIEHREQHKANQLMKLYGLTLTQHHTMYILQNGCCSICHNPVAYDDIHTDHNHTTNSVRELLCRRCNVLVGFVETSKDLLPVVLKYLDKHN